MVNIKFSLLMVLLVSSNVFSSIAPINTKTLEASKKISNESNSQMINLSMQFKAKNKIVKSELAMPYYQTAELERKFDNKNFLIEVNPRRGKNSNEVEIEMKFFKNSGSKAFAKKEIVAKMGEESRISVKGMTVKVTPIIN